ncbi:MAG: T9SS type A sorting domain-containing protein [Bacteroidaceae bacterium]|nr:T9SS type A sorting domain-containing protein [Bacteroidaceae bacterium]
MTDKLSQVQALQFLRYDSAEESNGTRANLEDIDIDIDNMSSERLDSIAKEMGYIEPERYLSPVQYGLAADQLKAVYPELVYEDTNGNVSINYVEMVPLLVQSIKELSARVAELEGTSPRTAKAPTDATAIEDNVADVDMVRMDQNKPNPFSESTVITLNIPRNAQAATIFIYDMSGKQVQNLPVSERGETDITVYANDLAAGMYIYTLVVDGKVSVTRRMIVSQI